MSFNLGVSNHPISRLGGLSSIGIYLYEDIYYRQWITEVALAFYEGRQDEFVNKIATLRSDSYGKISLIGRNTKIMVDSQPNLLYNT